MTGVSKEDMHVSLKGNRIVVTWRRFKVVETMEDGVKVRERKEKQYNQMIPLPEGTEVNLVFVCVLLTPFAEPIVFS